MKIWVDLANSPHALLFAPLSRAFKQRGATVFVTARDFAQTMDLARLHGISAEIVGKHGGKGTLGKARAILSRAYALWSIGRRARPDIAVSHNSYAQSIAARALGIPALTLMDYEHTPANHVSFRLCQRILLPSVIPLEVVERYGATARKVVPYVGYKEQIYLEDFLPDRSLLTALPAGIWERIVIVARPPADFAIYHNFKNPLFETWLHRVGSDPRAVVIVLPRIAEQAHRIAAMQLPSVIIPEHPLHGANLVYHADLVASAGGTMNREAAILGVPAYSIFAGKVAAVDRALEAAGRLKFVRSEDDLASILVKKKPPARQLHNPSLVENIVDQVFGLA